MAETLEFGLDTFGDVTADADGKMLSQAEVMRNVVEQGVLADESGVDFIGVGEHHRDDFSISAPDVVLAAIAGRTTRIRLGSAVTVLSSDEPIRVYQRFATLDAISSGRAEVILGRGSFIESFPLFGYELEDYERLFTEKLDLFAEILKQEPVTWQGTVRPPLQDQTVYPRTESGTLRTWIGVGGSPESVTRTARYNFPLMLAIIGGAPKRFRPYVDLYHETLGQHGADPLPVGVHSPGHIADTDEQARRELWPGYKVLHDRIGRERGWGPTSIDSFNAEADHGSLYVGSPETVAKKMAETIEMLGLSRFDLKYASGPLAHGKLMRSIELYGTKVAPMVRDMLS